MGPELVSALVFVAITLGVIAGYQLLVPVISRDGAQTARRVREDLRTAAREPDGTVSIFKTPEHMGIDPAAVTRIDIPRPEAVPLTRPGAAVTSWLQSLIEQANVSITPRQLFAAAAGLAAAAGFPALAFVGPVAGLAAAAAGGLAPLAALYFRREARRERIRSQLPAAFGLMARVIRSGHSVPQSIQAVADAFDGPLAAEFRRCQQQQALGIRPEITFHEMAERTGILEVRIFVTAMLIQRQTGGNLSETLERMAGLVRDRLRIRRQVRTLTAEGRLQGLTLLVLPVVVFAALMVINRKYAQVLLDQPNLLLATGGMMLVGVLWIRKIVNFEV